MSHAGIEETHETWGYAAGPSWGIGDEVVVAKMVVHGMNIRAPKRQKNGHLDVIKWPHENGCPWNGRTCNNAAEHGHYVVLIFGAMKMVSNGRSQHARTPHTVVIWKYSNGVAKMVARGTHVHMKAPQRRGYWKVTQWCQENDRPMHGT